MKTKCIGIRGHRGSGKNTLAYLLGNTIQWIHDNKVTSAEELLKSDTFNITWRVWCDCIIDDAQKALDNMDTPNIYLESFGYMPKMLIELLTDIPHEYIESDYYKDHVIVNISDFSWRVEEDPENKFAFDHQLLLDEILKENITEVDKEKVTMTLREFIVYFATVSMMFLGRSIWVKAMKCNEKRNSGYDDYYNIGTIYKIFKDIKASSELTYVKNNGGVIIKVSRPSNKKSKGVEQLKDDDRYDYSIVNTDITNDLEFRSQLVKIALDIYEK